MANSRTEHIEGLGSVRILKKRGVKRISLRLHSSGEIRVSQPFYLPFAAGLHFARTQTEWIKKQQYKQHTLELRDGMPIGKTRTLRIEVNERARTRITNNELILYVPAAAGALESPNVLLLYKKAVKRALTKEAKELLPPRVAELAAKYGYIYANATTKPLKSRWGACSSKKEITLNCYLLMLPWEIIDYVIMHELAHTRHMNHSPHFWADVTNTTSDYKALKHELKRLQPKVHAYYV